MKAKFFALLAVVLAVVSCQKDVDNLDVNMGGDVATISVALPEDAITRAGGVNSAQSGLANTTGELVRVIFEVYYQGNTNADLRQYAYLEEGVTTANFEVRLVPNRDYTFVAWADQVNASTKENNYFDVTDLKNVQILDWTAMDECRDAYTATEFVENFNSSMGITLTLTRPFAKLRVKNTDMAQLNDLGIMPTKATVTYITKHYGAFNAFEGKVIDDSKNRDIKHELYTIASYGENVAADADMTLFTDYFFATDNDEVINFTFDVYDQDNKLIKSNAFNTAIPVKRNNLTTIAGNILTDGNNINVEVKPEFGGKKEWPSEEAEKLAAAAMFGGEVTLTENVELNQPLLVKGNMTINLNGKTITNATNYAFENYAKLTINGNGNINGLGGIRSHGGEITINGGTFTCSSDWNNGTYNHILKAVNTKVVINGGTFDATIAGTTNAMINVSENSIIAINGGTFKNVNGTIPQFAPYMFTYEKNGKLIINDGDFYGGWRFNGETATTDIYGGNFTVSYDGQSFHAASTHVLRVYGGVFDLNNGGKLNPTNYVATGYKVIAKDGKFAVVAEDVDNVVANKTDIGVVLKDAVSAGSTNVVVDAMGANIGNLDYGLKTSLVPTGTTVTIRNAVVEGRSYGNGVNGTVIFDGCTFNNSGAYSIHFDNGNGDVIFKNCHLYGWNSFGSSLNSVSFENCTLDGNGTYALIRSYVNLTMTNCVINTSKANHNDVYSEGVEVISPATLTENNVTYVVENYDALKTAIINGGNIEFANDITVDEWIMFSEDLTISNGTIITVENINVSIDGKGHTLTVNSIESAGNNDQLFQGASVLNISNLTIKYADGLTTGGLGMVSGVIKNVHFIGGGSAASSAAIFPNNGKIKVEGCIFDTNGVALYFDDERDNLTVTGCTFNQKDNKNVILLRGDVKFTDNIINSGRTVNVVSGSPVVTGNNFNNVRFKVYGAATATISNNIINNLEFDGTSYASTFTGNTLSDAAQAVLNGATKVN